MKKVLLLTLFVFLFCGNSFAVADENDISLYTASYTDGDYEAISEIDAITPYRWVRLTFLCPEGADSATVETQGFALGKFSSSHLPSKDGRLAIAHFELSALQKATLTVVAYKDGEELKSHSFPITAVAGDEPNYPVIGIILESRSMTLQKGESESIYYRIEPENATDKVVSVESNNKNVVTVSDISVENETVSLKAVGKGEAIVTFTTHDGSYSADCDVTVTESTTGGGESGGSTGGATSGGGGGCDAGVAGVFAIGLLSAGIAVSKRRG